jgi:hypothetical protein
MTKFWAIAVLISPSLAWAVSPAVDPQAAERGRKALEQRSFNPPVWSFSAYENVWKQWGLSLQPHEKEFAEEFRRRYGLHPAPFPNDGLPMGLRKNTSGILKGLSVDCLICHGGSIMGQSYIGLGNSTLEIHSLFEEMNKASGRGAMMPFQFTNVRGTSEAGGMAVFLLGHRTPDLALQAKRTELGLHDDLCEDPPAWWTLKKKKSMYHTGGADARSVRSLMQFMMGPLNGPGAFEREEAVFADIQAFLLSLQPPKYPFPVDSGLAAKGQTIFERTCSKCHGTYGKNWSYPNRVVKIDEIGTDRRRFDGITEEYARYYDHSWFAREKKGWFIDEYRIRASTGYQAPPLDGIWATAPYFHNGSAPTVYNVLKSESRPKLFTRSFRTDKDAYDPVKLGWKVQEVDRTADPALPAIERRKVYDTSQPGRGNGGHVFGDDLSEEERMALIEYLKTL